MRIKNIKNNCSTKHFCSTKQDPILPAVFGHFLDKNKSGSNINNDIDMHLVSIYGSFVGISLQFCGLWHIYGVLQQLWMVFICVLRGFTAALWWEWGCGSFFGVLTVTLNGKYSLHWSFAIAIFGVSGNHLGW